jgi:hypothetical protein
MTEPLMNPRDAVYSSEGMIDDHSYSLDAAKAAALETVRACAPRTIQHLLDMLLFYDYEDDDLNRRAVLYLLDQKDIVIDRELGRIRLADQ